MCSVRLGKVVRLAWHSASGSPVISTVGQLNSVENRLSDLLGKVALEQRHKDGLTLGVRFAADLGGSEMELEGTHCGAALLIPGATRHDTVAVAGELLLPGEGIPDGGRLLAQGCDSGLVGPGTDTMVQG
ncbi:hypothetical protein D3C71_1259850 [compost metagenome]